MNPKRNMIIVNGTIKTKEISSCKYNPNTKKWDVTYCGSNKVYAYGYMAVEWLREPKAIPVNTVRVGRDGRAFFDIQEIYEFGGKGQTYWHICFGDGSERDYLRQELQISQSCLSDKAAHNVFGYLAEIAKLSELKNEETGEKILAKRYEKLKFVDKAVALSAYLNPAHRNKAQAQQTIPIFPFGCNKSQYKAVKNALENQISVIQGPPGTGKTQTILNIIANILMQGKTVQIVSNNNAAIENVYEKLSAQYGLGFIVASLGNAENKKAFIDHQNGHYPEFAGWRIEENGTGILEDIKNKSVQLGEVFDKQERLACLKQEQAQLELERKYFQQYLDETQIDVDALNVKRKLTSRKILELWQKCQSQSENDKKISLLFKIKSIMFYGICDWQFYKQDISKIITSFQGLYYKYRREEIEKEIEEISGYLKKVNAHLLDDVCGRSMIVLKDALARRYQDKKARVIFTQEDLYKNAEAVLKEYPVVLSTTFSSRSSLNSEVLYDYLIMDEASQVDVATGALALSTARNAIIVGDTRQLPNVITEDVRNQADVVFDTFKINEGYRFTKSFLQSVIEILPDVTQVMLREHYRCHPKIINFCNQKFYKGELVIMTEDHGEPDVLMAIKTVVGNHARDHYSQRQIDVIKQEVIPQLKSEKKDIGIITPYKNQVEALTKELDGDIEVATVHKFQGREKDTIIISTVDDEISDFTDDPYLLNVAVSRAKKKLVVVVSGNEQSPERNISDLINYIQYNNFEVKESKIYSVFDYLYKQYTEVRQKYLQEIQKKSEFVSENLMYALIEKVLNDEGYFNLDVVCHFPLNMLIRDPVLLNDREAEYAMNPATHLDFLIYNRIGKKPVLAVEVDGYSFHKAGTVQSERDKLKDHILQLYEIPLVRFSTTGSNEQQTLKHALEQAIAL